ncbi:hypothetical protein G6F37_006973 [Rhizopus arrhizus]|nr:hypothetical protein G6F38_009281 [Rhizopus arrhizus]KAG1157132.1 hypothetical protein G6F37_006973 [Rhizopus arrhizus]
MATLQCIIIVALQAVVCYLNTYEASLLPKDINNTTTTESIPQQAEDRLDRIKWENVAFISFQCWFIYMVFDATTYQNTAEILALAILNAVCAILGALQIFDGVKWLQRLTNVGSPVGPLFTAEKLEIALSAVLVVFAIIMAFLSIQMSKQFGWNIYKKIGADVQIQKMYRTFQFFVLSLKINIFTGFLVSLFYLIQFALKKDHDNLWKTVIQVIVTAIILPMLYFARTAGSTEKLFHFVLILDQTFQPNDYWYTWIVLVFIGIILNMTSSILGFICMRNFKKGLKPFVQRGSNKAKMDIESNALKTRDEWQIDED